MQYKDLSDIFADSIFTRINQEPKSLKQDLSFILAKRTLSHFAFNNATDSEKLCFIDKLTESFVTLISDISSIDINKLTQENFEGKVQDIAKAFLLKLIYSCKEMDGLYEFSINEDLETLLKEKTISYKQLTKYMLPDALLNASISMKCTMKNEKDNNIREHLKKLAIDNNTIDDKLHHVQKQISNANKTERKNIYWLIAQILGQSSQENKKKLFSDAYFAIVLNLDGRLNAKYSAMNELYDNCVKYFKSLQGQQSDNKDCLLSLSIEEFNYIFELIFGYQFSTFCSVKEENNSIEASSIYNIFYMSNTVNSNSIDFSEEESYMELPLASQYSQCSIAKFNMVLRQETFEKFNHTPLVLTKGQVLSNILFQTNDDYTVTHLSYIRLITFWYFIIESITKIMFILNFNRIREFAKLVPNKFKKINPIKCNEDLLSSIYTEYKKYFFSDISSNHTDIFLSKLYYLFSYYKDKSHSTYTVKLIKGINWNNRAVDDKYKILCLFHYTMETGFSFWMCSGINIWGYKKVLFFSDVCNNSIQDILKELQNKGITEVDVLITNLELLNKEIRKKIKNLNSLSIKSMCMFKYVENLSTDSNNSQKDFELSQDCANGNKQLINLMESTKIDITSILFDSIFVNQNINVNTLYRLIATQYSIANEYNSCDNYVDSLLDFSIDIAILNMEIISVESVFVLGVSENMNKETDCNLLLEKCKGNFSKKIYQKSLDLHEKYIVNDVNTNNIIYGTISKYNNSSCISIEPGEYYKIQIISNTVLANVFDVRDKISSLSFKCKSSDVYGYIKISEYDEFYLTYDFYFKIN